MSESNHMWTAVAILGGLWAYNTLKKDAGTIVETVADAVNITKDTNLAYKGVNKLVGEKNFQRASESIFDIFNPAIKKQREETERMLKGETSAQSKKDDKEYQSYNPRAANYRAKAKETAKPKSTEAGLPARQFNGKWLKLVNKQWLPLTKSDKVFNVRGAYIVHHYLWKP